MRDLNERAAACRRHAKVKIPECEAHARIHLQHTFDESPSLLAHEHNKELQSNTLQEKPTPIVNLNVEYSKTSV